MKRIWILALALCLLGGCTHPDNASYLGDVNGDGKVGELDVALLQSYLNHDPRSWVHAENADLDGDFVIGETDLSLLKKLVGGEKVALAGVPFSREDGDVTDRLESLGIQNYPHWSNDQLKFIDSRVPMDMISSKDRVYISSGNYDQNTGPVPLFTYTNAMDKGMALTTLPTEQIDEFHQYDGHTFALGVDPKNWGMGEFYYEDVATGEWVKKTEVLTANIHCYDMIQYKGAYFFCGSNTADEIIDGKTVDCSKAVVFRLEGDLASSTVFNYKDVPIILENGEPLTYTSIIKRDAQLGYSYASGIPRMHLLFVYNDSLYAYYFDQYTDEYTGFYRYDEKTQQFVYDATLDATAWNTLCRRNPQDMVKIAHQFVWGNTLYVIADDLYATDLSGLTAKKFERYADYRVQDVLFRNEKALVLLSCEKEDGTFQNVVLETDDMKNGRALLSFFADLPAKSFEFNCGAFYFGLGYVAQYQQDNNGNLVYDFDAEAYKMKLPAHYKKAGTVLRYRYYR